MKTIYCLLLIWLLGGCSRQPAELDPSRYMGWISAEKNGLVKRKTVNGVNIQTRFLPAEYLAYRDLMARQDMVPFDTLLNSYKCGLAFQITLEADKNSAYGNLLYHNAATEQEVQARIRYLSFNIEEFITLRNESLELTPVLSNFEGYDQLGNKVSFQVAFVIPEFKCGNPGDEFKSPVLVFDDPVWGLGVNQFEYDRQSIVHIPRISY